MKKLEDKKKKKSSTVKRSEIFFLVSTYTDIEDMNLNLLNIITHLKNINAKIMPRF